MMHFVEVNWYLIHQFHVVSCLDGRDDTCLDGRELFSEIDDLTLGLSCLSTSTNSPLTVRMVLPTIAVVSYGRRRYYIIIIGKCAGIYYDVWSACTQYTMLTFHSYLILPRDNVEPLIRYVSNAHHKSFPTFEMATAYYLDAKRRNLVRIVRDHGDDLLYGPINAAVQ